MCLYVSLGMTVLPLPCSEALARPAADSAPQALRAAAGELFPVLRPDVDAVRGVGHAGRCTAPPDLSRAVGRHGRTTTVHPGL